MNNIREIDDWTPASAGFTPALKLLEGLGRRLREYELVPGTALFETVAVYSAPDLLAAFEDLRTFGDRVCLIIPSSDNFKSQADGSELRTEAMRDIDLVICDRDVGQRQYALIGEPDPTGSTPDASLTPGVIRIKDFLTHKLLGDHLDLAPRRIRFRPLNGQSFKIVGTNNGTEWGRAGWQMTWQADAGMMSRRIR